MSYIPSCSQPFRDELLFSWLHRLADENNLPFDLFATVYLGHNNPRMPSYFVYDSAVEIQEFYRHQLCFSSKKELFLSTGVFQFESAFLTEGEQTHYINKCFRPAYALKPYKNRSLIHTCKICPECLKEDRMAHGKGYLHRAHHLSGVQTCYKHKCLLFEYAGKRGNETSFDEAFYRPIIPEPHIKTESLYAYTAYAQKLFDVNINTNIDILKTTILDRLLEIGYSGPAGREQFLPVISSWEHVDLFHYPCDMLLGRKLFSIKNLRPDDVVALLMFFFPDPQELIDKLPVIPDTVLEATCSQCGQTYETTEKAQRDGWLCPMCVKGVSSEDQYRAILSHLGDGSYELLDDYTSSRTALLHKHNSCGEVFQAKAYDMLYGHRRCSCEARLSREQAAKRIERSGEFKLIEFHGKDNPISILHHTCNRQFSARYSSFISHPNCKFCFPENQYNESRESLVSRMKDLVGDEYTLLDYRRWAEKVRVRHNVCGTEYEVLPTNFLAGSRCTRCLKILQRHQLKELLEISSSSRYTIIKSCKGKHYVLDTVTGKEKLISVARLRQELSRPTPSDILPFIDQSLICDKPATSWDIAFHLYTDYVKEHNSLYPPKGELYRGFDLGLWCQHQRDDYRKGKLNENRIKQLNDFGFGWDPLNDIWEHNFQLFLQHKEETGSFYVPVDLVYKDVKLGLWLTHQRTKFKEGSLSLSRVKRLQDVDKDVFTVPPRKGRIKHK